MQYERRKAKRIEVNLPARWEGVLEQSEATVTSLSANGCFVLTGGNTAARELVRLEIDFPDGTKYFWGEVVDEAQEIGFALRFNSLDDDDRARLEAFIQDHEA